MIPEKILEDWKRLGMWLSTALTSRDFPLYQRVLRLLDSDRMMPPKVTIETMVRLEWNTEDKYTEFLFTRGEELDFYFRNTATNESMGWDDLMGRRENRNNDPIVVVRDFVSKEFPAQQEQLALGFDKPTD